MKNWKNSKYLFIVMLTTFIFGLNIQFNAIAQIDQSSYIELQQLLTNRSENEKKLSSDLFGKIFIYNKSISEGRSNIEAMKSFDKDFYDNQNRIFINIRLSTKNESDGQIIKETIQTLNGKIEGINPGHNALIEIKCWMPINSVNMLINHPSVGLIRTPTPPQFRIVTTAGDAQLKAQEVRTQMNVNGEGNRIGVISDGIKSYTNGVIPTEELSFVNQLNPGDVNGDEGTAMLEIIHDIAPSASLYFYGMSPTSDFYTFESAINAFVTNECNIIVDDIGFYNEPYFTDEDTSLGSAIRDFLYNGGVFISAEGNDNY